MQSNTGLLTFKKTKTNKVDGWVMWNKALHIFIEIYSLKFPSKCINLVQYSGILNNLAGKFPFAQVYNYDKDFCQQMEQQPEMLWHQIDQQLWSTSLHGINTINQSQHQQQCTGGSQNRQQQFRKKQEWPFRHCFDHSRGNCTRQSCSFPHICGYCGSPNHTTYNCPTCQEQQQYSSSSGQQPATSGPQGHPQCRAVHATNPTQSGSSANATSTSSAIG